MGDHNLSLKAATVFITSRVENISSEASSFPPTLEVSLVLVLQSIFMHLAVRFLVGLASLTELVTSLRSSSAPTEPLGPSAFVAPGAFPTGVYSHYYHAATATSAQVQPVISDPVSVCRILRYPHQLIYLSVPIA